MNKQNALVADLIGVGVTGPPHEHSLEPARDNQGEGSSPIKPKSAIAVQKDDVPKESLSVELRNHGLVLSDDGYVRWDRQNTRHPRNWSGGMKAYNAIVIILLEFFTSTAGTAGTVAAQQAQKTYGISRSFSVFAFTSLYLIGQAVGGIFFPPYSESFGRKTLYILSTFGYCIFSAIVASIPSLPAVLVARLISGFLSSIPTIVVAGSIEDMFNMKARVWMIFIWAITGNLAVTVGPIYSTYVTYTIGWQWVFYIMTIITGILFVLCFWLTESRPSLVLDREVVCLQKVMPDTTLKALNPDSAPDFKTLVNVALIRPVRLLFTEPIIIMVAFMGSVVCAVWYLFAEALLITFKQYGWSEQVASLSFIPVGIGSLCGFFTRLYDNRTLETRQKQGKVLEPENKLFGFALAAPVLAIGLWWFAWTVPPMVHVHWIVPFLALVLVGFALNEFVYTLAGYLADSYTIYAASGFAGLILARASTTAVVLPFTHLMYTNLGPNIANTILACVATAFCAAPFVFFTYGKRLREASKFARYSLDTYRHNQVEDDMNDAATVADE